MASLTITRGVRTDTAPLGYCLNDGEGMGEDRGGGTASSGKGTVGKRKVVGMVIPG